MLKIPISNIVIQNSNSKVLKFQSPLDLTDYWSFRVGGILLKVGDFFYHHIIAIAYLWYYFCVLLDYAPPADGAGMDFVGNNPFVSRYFSIKSDYSKNLAVEDVRRYLDPEQRVFDFTSISTSETSEVGFSTTSQSQSLNPTMSMSTRTDSLFQKKQKISDIINQYSPFVNLWMYTLYRVFLVLQRTNIFELYGVHESMIYIGYVIVGLLFFVVDNYLEVRGLLLASLVDVNSDMPDMVREQNAQKFLLESFVDYLWDMLWTVIMCVFMTFVASNIIQYWRRGESETTTETTRRGNASSVTSGRVISGRVTQAEKGCQRQHAELLDGKDGNGCVNGNANETKRSGLKNRANLAKDA